MTDPTTQDVKDAYAWGLSGTSRTTQECDDEFDRWLNEIRAEAWDEGFLRGEKSGVSEIPLNPREWNPYRPNEK